jgi:hypothetical protein
MKPQPTITLVTLDGRRITRLIEDITRQPQEHDSEDTEISFGWETVDEALRDFAFSYQRTLDFLTMTF